VVDRTRFPAAVDALEQVLARHHPGIVGVADAVACAVLTGGVGEAPAEFARSVRAELSAALGVRGATCAAVGPTATGHMGLAHSMSEARLSLLVAQQQQVEDTVVAAQGLAVERFLHRYENRAELRQYVDEQLGRLLQHDARRGSTLVATLDAFLACGGSKAAAAVRLHLRRQSLYYRNDPRDRTALAVALAALRLIGGTR
jgi:purine catabolism regulator